MNEINPNQIETDAGSSTNKDERLWAMLCHLSAFSGLVIPFGHIIGPVLLWSLKKDQSAFIDEHGRASINFQLSMTIYLVATIFLVIFLVGIPLLFVVLIAEILFTVIASLKASDGQSYHYPLSIQFI